MLLNLFAGVRLGDRGAHIPRACPHALDERPPTHRAGAAQRDQQGCGAQRGRLACQAVVQKEFKACTKRFNRELKC